MSSSRPTNGLTKVAPALAASSACAAEKHERDVDADAFARQRLAGVDAVARQRHLDDHVLVDGRDVVALRGSCRRSRSPTTSPLTGPLTMSQIFFRFCAVVARLLRQQRRIRRDAVDDAEAASVSMSLMLPVSTKSFIRDSASTGLRKFADAFDGDRDHVAVRERPDAGRRAGGNDVARLERHDEGDVLDEVLDAEDQLRGGRRWRTCAVHPRLDRARLAVAPNGNARPDRRERVEALAARVLRFLVLEVARGDVVEARDAEDVVPGVARRAPGARGVRSRPRARPRNRRARRRAAAGSARPDRAPPSTA